MSNGVKKYGLEYDRQRDRTYPYYEQELEYAENPANSMKTGSEAALAADQTPTDRAAAKFRQYDAASFLAGVQAQAPVALPDKVRVSQLPPTLLSVSVTFNKSGGSGSSEHLASDMLVEIVNAGSGSLDPRSTAQASASIIPVLSWDIENWQADAVVNCTNWAFTDAPGMTVANIITRTGVSGLHDLPIFKKKSHQITCLGKQVSLQQSADSRVSLQTNDSSSALSSEKGFSNSTEVGVQGHIETIPESIHGAITISSPTDSQSVSITVKADIPALPTTGSAITVAVTNEPTALSGSAAGSVSPTSLSATSPAAIPVTGKYITGIQTSLGELGTVDYVITVVDFSQYA